MLKESRYSKILTILLIILIIGMLIGIGFVVYNVVSGNKKDKENEEIIEAFVSGIKNKDENNNNGNNGDGQSGYLDGEEAEAADFGNGGNGSGGSGGTGTKPIKPVSYNTNTVIGVLEIPKTKIKYQIYSEVTVDSLNKAVAMQYGVGLNKTGNTVIAGHNMRNGKFFSNNKKLENGDEIYITDDTGKKVTYKIYKIYYTNPSDTEFFIRDTKGAREISLTTCSDDSKERLIIWAKAN